jgi:hypothetical protein
MRAAMTILAATLPLTSLFAEPREASKPAQAHSPRAVLSADPACRQPGLTLAGDVPLATRSQRLGELPPANQYLAVVRVVQGCPEPAIVRSGIGR